MSSVVVQHNLSTFVDAVAEGNRQAIEQAAQQTITRAEDALELIGQIGLLVMDGDSDGHLVRTLGAASVLTRWLIALRHTLGEEGNGQVAGLPLVTQALTAAIPAVQAARQVAHTYPQGLFPSELGEHKTVSAALREAIDSNNAPQVERLLFGLYGTGADYRTSLLRLYDGVAPTFQEDGNVLLDVVRGGQLLSAVKWGNDAPHYLHWLAPHLTVRAEEPAWANVVRAFLSDPAHSLASYRTRLATPRNGSALPLRTLLLSSAESAQVCQGVFDALITNGASAHGVAAVIALAASDLLAGITEQTQDWFEHAAHGLLFASAAQRVFEQVQAVEALPTLFMAAAHVNALYKERGKPETTHQSARSLNPGGGLIAPSLLETLLAELVAGNTALALANARRYVQLGYDSTALFATIGLGAASVASGAERDYALQIVQAAGEVYLSWPADLADTSMESLLQIALRAATGQHA
jgi:hypothetical protein